MRYLIIVLLTSIVSNSYSQLSLNEMILVYKMDLDQFESFALRKGYKIHRMKESDDTYGMSFVKGFSENTKYISLYTHYFSYGKAVNMQTGKTADFLALKDQLKSQGYKLDNTENSDGWLKKTYIKSVWEIKTYSGNNDNGDPIYEIHLQKRNN